MEIIIFEKPRVEGAPESSSTKVNELALHASFKYIFVGMARERFYELAFSLGRRELIMIFTSLYLFFITRARLIKPSEITPASLCPMLFVPQWIKIYCRKGDKYMLFTCHSTFWILSPPIPTLSGWNFEKSLSNIELNLLKLAIIDSPINKTLHLSKLIVRYAWFLKVSYHPRFPITWYRSNQRMYFIKRTSNFI